MSRGAHKLKQSDITKAVKGVEKASMGVVQRNSVNEWDSVK
jgi:hypothetical protein